MLFMNRLALVTFSVITLRGDQLVPARVAAVLPRGAKWIARINAFLQNLTGMSVVQLFRREERNAAAFAAINRAHADANVAPIFYYAVFYPAIDVLAAVAVALILLYGGGRVLAGTLSLGALVAFIQYSERFWRPISDLSEKFNILQAAMAASERIFTLLDTAPQVVARAQPIRLLAVRGRVASSGCGSTISNSHQPEQRAERIHSPRSERSGVRHGTPCSRDADSLAERAGSRGAQHPLASETPRGH